MVEVVELTDDALLGRICKRLRKSAVSVLGGYLLAEFTQLTLFPSWSCSILIIAWEQRKLGELYSLVSEKNDLTFGRESIISVANMYFNANVNVADEQYLRTYNVMRLGDIAFEGHSNKEFSHGRFVENYIGDGIVSHIFTVLRPRVPFDVNYWRYAINNEKLMRLSLIRSTKASTMMHDLVPSDFLREAIPTPTLAEQKEIGAFLVGLDHLITLHQRKRCNGPFTHPLVWEQRKLGEVASIKTGPFGSMLHAEDYVDNGIPIVTTEHFKSGFLPDEKAGLPQVSESDRARLEQYSAIEGDILFSRVGSVDVNAQVTAAQSGWLFSGRVLRARPAASVIRPNYLHYELSTDDVKRSIINRAVGGTMASINTEILEDTEIIFPRSAREQSEIGGFLGNLDHLITLHQ